MTQMHHLGATAAYAESVLEQGRAFGYPMLSLRSETIAAGEVSWRTWVDGATRRQLAQALGVLVAQRHRQR